MTARRRWRGRLQLLGLLPLLAALAFTLVVVAMERYNQTGRDHLASGGLQAAAEAFASSGRIDALEPWVAPYDEGTTAYLREEYADARRLLEQSLADAPAAEECRVRTNLALAHEALGDAARADGDLAAARTAWATGREVLATGGCTTEPDTAVSATAVDQRLVTRLVDTRDQRTDEERDPPPEQDEAETSLAERNERAEDVRRQQEQRRQDREDREDRENRDEQPPTYSW